MPDLQAEGAFEPNGDTIKLRGEAKTLAALQLLGFHQLLDIPPTSTNANLQPAKAHTVGILPLSPIATEEQQLQAVDAICTIALAAIGQGNGMAGSYEIVRLNGGTYQIWTGDVVCEPNKGKRRPSFQSMPAVFGTGVMVSLDTSKPVDLASTWIASATGAECLFLNTQTEAASDSGLNVAAECLHTGGRAPAKLLRRKIQDLLPGMDGEPLILDELQGSLADEDPRGQPVFNGFVRIRGMNRTVQAMANVVVAQRLGSPIDRSPDAED